MAERTERTVLITGCSSGIGRATATYLAERGWHVFATARRLESIEDLKGPHIDLLQLDVTDEGSRVAAIEAALAQAGHIDALVNNAAFSIGGPVELVSLDQARQQFETNVWGALRLCQLVTPAMRAQGGGRIVNVTSVMGKVSVPFSGLYASSKWALEALSDNLRWELYPWNIRVSVVEPGFVQTRFGANSEPFSERFLDNPLYARYLQRNREIRTPVQRGTKPITVARVIERALTDPVPAPRYRSGWDAQAALTARAVVPDRVYDFIIRTFFGLNRQQRRTVSADTRPTTTPGTIALGMGLLIGIGLAFWQKRQKR